ncbi:MAG TPA: ATP synthase F1 subunit epsilon [Aggregatilineales bacterium]|nr:ATP synthase F1 subunit epsilon [Aggregatilineales bacterium]
MPLHVKIVTQDGILFEDPAADMVILPGSEGEMGVLPHHAALLSTLNFGEVRVRKSGAEESFIVYGGIVEVRPDKVTVLADTAESSYDVDEEKASEARQRAEQLIREGVPAEAENTILQDLHRATIQERVLSKVRSRNVARIRVIEDENSK